ncbi:hypothetical protein ACO0RG_002534 [Hanseniaspora osmophila]
MAIKGRKYIPNQHLYKNPLPVHPLDLPLLIPHNPVSWVYWLYSYFTQSSFGEKIPVLIENVSTVSNHECACLQIIVPSEKHRQYLWRNGFFGKGSLSRTEATWYKRSFNVANKASLEEVTKKRREQRLLFKQERIKYEEKQLELRRAGILDSETLLADDKEFLRQLRDRELFFEKSLNTPKTTNVESISPEEKEDLEKFILSPTEAFFLVYGLAVLDISTTELAKEFHDQVDILTFIRNYAAYHHYRSHGWCVRDGVKFGCNYLLYKRGPPFSHAEFAINVMNTDNPKDYTFYSSLSRVIGGASKTLILTYVSFTEPHEKMIDLWNRHKYSHIFENCIQINEFVYKRWSPGRHRD